MSASAQKIAIVTDSTADLAPAVAAESRISVIPLQIVYRDHSYRDGIDITVDEVYASIDKEIPSTSTPSPQDAIDLLAGLRDKGFTHAICIHLSSAISRTLDTVRLAAEEVADLKTALIDSKVISMGLGFIALEAARLAAEGRTSFDALVERVKAMVPHSNIFCVLKTLEYFRRGGRIGAVAATVAGVLDIKPIISMKDGVFLALARVRGRKHSLDVLFDLARQAVEDGANRISVMHGAAREEAQALLERVKTIPGVVAPALGQIGTTIGVHSGPGTVGVCAARV